MCTPLQKKTHGFSGHTTHMNRNSNTKPDWCTFGRILVIPNYPCKIYKKSFILKMNNKYLPCWVGWIYMAKLSPDPRHISISRGWNCRFWWKINKRPSSADPRICYRDRAINLAFQKGKKGQVLWPPPNNLTANASIIANDTNPTQTIALEMTILYLFIYLFRCHQYPQLEKGWRGCRM